MDVVVDGLCSSTKSRAAFAKVCISITPRTCDKSDVDFDPKTTACDLLTEGFPLLYFHPPSQ